MRAGVLNQCCHCGCDKINFKVFDFSDGTLLWQKLLWSPTLDTSGNVFALSAESTFEGKIASGAGTASSDKTLTLATRASATLATYTVAQVDKYVSTTGVLTSSSPAYEVITGDLDGTKHFELSGSGPITGLSKIRGMTASAWQVNSSGDKVEAQSNPYFGAWVVEPDSTDTELTYYIAPCAASAADVIFTDSDGNEATVSITDNAAAIKAEIEAELSCTLATVTGTAINKSLVKIVIDWNDNTKYLDTLELDYATTNTSIGNVYLRNLNTGLIGNSADTGGSSSSYNGVYAWQSDGNLFRQGANASNATIRRYESWDTSTNPWTLDWSDEPFGARSPIGDGYTMREIELCADGGIVSIGYPLTAGTTDILINRTSILSWDNDGTGEEEYHNMGNNFTGWVPLGLCIEDGSDKLACNYVVWKDENVEDVHGSSFSDDVYLNGDGEGCVRWSSGSGYSLLSSTCRGDFEQNAFAGFDATTSAICNRTASSAEDNENQAAVTNNSGQGATAYYVASEPSGMVNLTTLVSMNRWRLHWEVHTVANSLIDDDTDWRVVFTDGGTTAETGWLDKSATLADLNTELFTLFDESRNGDDNCVATADSDTTPSTPLYKRTLVIEGLGAKNSGDETDMETPSLFTLTSGAANFARAQMPVVTVELSTYSRDVAGTIGARNWSTGVVSWDRNFNTSSNPKLIKDGCLNDGRLYVLANATQCSETIPEEEEETPP